MGIHRRIFIDNNLIYRLGVNSSGKKHNQDQQSLAGKYQLMINELGYHVSILNVSAVSWMFAKPLKHKSIQLRLKILTQDTIILSVYNNFELELKSIMTIEIHRYTVSEA